MLFLLFGGVAREADKCICSHVRRPPPLCIRPVRHHIARIPPSRPPSTTARPTNRVGSPRPPFAWEPEDSKLVRSKSPCILPFNVRCVHLQSTLFHYGHACTRRASLLLGGFGDAGHTVYHHTIDVDTPPRVPALRSRCERCAGAGAWARILGGFFLGRYRTIVLRLWARPRV